MSFLLLIVIILISLGMAQFKPFWLVFFFMITAVMPNIAFATTPFWNEEYAQITRGFYVYDVILLAMMIVMIPRWWKERHRMGVKVRRLFDSFFFFLGWLFFEIIRNIPQYGLSSFGEFRYEYLMLVMPIYVALYFKDESIQKRLLGLIKFYIFFLPILVFPIVGSLKGFQFGSQDRFYTAAIEIGYPLGILLLLVRQKYLKTIEFNIFYIFSLVFIVIIMLIDSHRSVMISVVIGFFIYILLGKVKISFRMIAAILVLTAVGVYVLSLIGFNYQYDFISRIQAYTQPENDETSKWRLELWTVLMVDILKKPWTGSGFGGWWNIYVPEINQNITATPHSFYMQSLSRIGVIGLFLYLVFIYRCTIYFFQIYVIKIIKNNYNKVAAVIGIITIIIMHVFFITYTPVYYILIILGYSIATSLDIHSTS
ncbi:MAG: O-antigen ligase family protein [Ignavibacteriaceae bacterium]|jgi:hypothetical protein